MLQTSQDLLFIVLAFCVLWITILLCWGLYYLVVMLRNTYKITKNVNQKVEAFGELIEALKSKVSSMAAFLTLFSHGISALIDHIKEKREKEENKSINNQQLTDNNEEVKIKVIKK
ncbi:hypothetical protein HY750_03420 [Candidatus Kuenenbacteria bacterium]|nr:hypothetical protein [Candidatus Kuenenbacteria bacterium]